VLDHADPFSPPPFASLLSPLLLLLLLLPALAVPSKDPIGAQAASAKAMRATKPSHSSRRD